MTTDKIKGAIGDYLWFFWQNNHDVKAIENAEKILKKEIENGLRRRFQDFAEYKLLCIKLGKEVNLNLKHINNEKRYQ